MGKAAKPKRRLVIVGGREDKEGESPILRRVVELAAGGKIVLATLASEEPDEQWAVYSKTFTRLGAKKVQRLDYGTREDVMANPRLELLEGASLIFFSGGDQLKLTSKIAGTPVYDKVLALFESGVPVAGTSAGAAAMSETMIVGNREDSHKVGSAFRTAPGLGLAKDMIIDQHFAQRWRIGRLLGAVAEKPSALGIGIDENTGIDVHGESFEVIGTGAVYVVDGRGLTYTNVSEEEYDRTMAIFDVKLHVLKPGNCFHCDTRRPFLCAEAPTKKHGKRD